MHDPAYRVTSKLVEARRLTTDQAWLEPADASRHSPVDAAAVNARWEADRWTSGGDETDVELIFGLFTDFVRGRGGELSYVKHPAWVVYETSVVVKPPRRLPGRPARPPEPFAVESAIVYDAATGDYICGYRTGSPVNRELP